VLDIFPQCDQAALTGESLPVTLRPGASAMMGSTITRGEIEAVCTATGGMTFFGKTAMLINNVDDMAHFEKIFYQINFSLTSLGGVCCVSVFMTLMLR
jgi:H+-transporting ATPase